MEVVRMERRGVAAWLTIDRPKCLNALNDQVYEELIAHLEQIEHDDGIRAVILTGAGDRAFAAGADISQMVYQDAIAARHLSWLCHRAAELLEGMRQITIAAVNGYAFGGGCELTLACDIRIAAENARFALPEVTLGIIPAGGGTQRLGRLIGVGRAKELIFTGDQIDAQEAYRLGLANHVVPVDALHDTCQALAEKIASRAGYAVSMAKACVNASMDLDVANGSRKEEDVFGMLFATHDRTEGMEAFLARRKPEFTDF